MKRLWRSIFRDDDDGDEEEEEAGETGEEGKDGEADAAERSKTLRCGPRAGIPALGAAPAKVRREHDLSTLLTHEINDGIRVVGSARAREIFYGGTHLSGLLRVLQTVFYPEYDYATARSKDCTVPPGEYTIPLPIDGARRGGKGHVVGAERGSIVDEDLETWANNRAVWNGRARHPVMAVDVVDAFEQWRWKPIVSQFPLAAPHIRVATRADMIVLDAADTPILLEIKTGYEKYLDKCNGMMRGPLYDKPNTPLNQHYLQVGIEMLIAKHCYGFEFKRCYVVQAMHERGIVPHELPAWFYERDAQIWRYFSEGSRVGSAIANAAPPRRRGPFPGAAKI